MQFLVKRKVDRHQTSRRTPIPHTRSGKLLSAHTAVCRGFRAQKSSVEKTQILSFTIVLTELLRLNIKCRTCITQQQFHLDV